MGTPAPAMAERRKQAAKKLEKLPMNPKTPMTKEQREVTDWLKKNVPTKKTKFLHSHVVDYFSGTKAVDLLTSSSPWAETLFSTREASVEYMDGLLRYKMFHRAKKIAVTKDYLEDRKKGRNRKEDKSEDKIDKSDVEGKTDTDIDKESETGEEDKAEKTEKSEKKKRQKIRLDMHLEQIFVDSTDAFVWLYDPIPWYYWLFGGGICVVVIIFCLFPLWPRVVRRGSQWLATAGVGFLVGVIVLGIFKYLLFSVLYLLSARKFRFWIMPNLTKDVGFLASFWPLYEYTYTGEVIEEGSDEADDCPTVPTNEESDSNESGKSAFEIIDKSKE